MHPALMLGLALSLGAPAPKEKPKSEPTIVGEWEFVEGVVGGKPDVNLQQNPFRVVITAETWTVVRNAMPGLASPIRIDPKAAPAQMDLGINNGNMVSCPSIYKIEGDTLTICYDLGPMRERPKTFESPMGSQVRIIVLKRAKPEK